MADEKDVAVVETSMANPKQAVNVLENIEKVSAEFTPVNTLQNNAPLFKQEENNEFFNSDAWSDFKTDMFRAYNSKRYPGFAAIETTADNPAYSTIINRYGKAIANRAQAMHSTYAKANSWIGRISDAYNSQRYGLRAAAARKDLSNAIRDGDEAEVARAKMLYQSEQRKSYEEGVEFDDYGNTLMSLAASTARNPATLLVEGVGVAAAPVTAGWSLAAANAINAAIVGADTYKVESGSALQSLDENAPEMTEQQKFEKARVVGGINAAVEAGLFAVGGNIAGRGLQKVGKEAAVEVARSAVRKKTGEEISRDAAKQMIKTDFIKALQNPAKEKAFKDTVAGFALDVAKGAPGEGWQEVFQNSVTDAMLRSVKNGTTLTDEMLDDWADFITNPFDERHADKWETFINVTAASMVLGGGYTAAGTGVRKLGSLTRADTRHDGTGTIQDKALGAYNNSLGLSKLFNWHQNGDAKNALGASNAVLEEQIKRGEVSGKLYTTAEQVQEMQQDPEIAAALEEMGIATSLSESAENGGVVEIDLLAYDRVVNESQNTTLFQKMRNYLSFSDTTMSLNEFNQFINSKGKELASLITDEVRNDQESVYNKLKNMAIKAGRTAERAEGYAVMGHVMLNNLQALTKGEKNDILDRLTLTVDQGNGQILSENFGAKQEAKQPTQGLSAIDGSALTTYDAQGNLKDEVWQQIRNLFPAEKLQQVYTSERGGSRTFEELLRSTVDTPQQAAQERKMQAIEPVAKYFEITPEQLMNAIRLARGEVISTTPGTADVNVGGMVDATFTEDTSGNAPVYHMFVGVQSNTSALPQGLQDRLQKARMMLGEGKSDKEVFEATHMHIAPDGSLRIQISDVDGQLTEDSGRVLKWTKDKYGKEKLRSTTCHLEDIFDHELLYELYPGLRSLPVTIKGSSTYASGLGSYINLGTNETKSRIRQSILHEVQHIIQHYESFAKGGKSSYPKTTNMDYAKRNTLIQKVAPKLVENKVITYWAASEGGDSSSSPYNRLGSPDEMRALIDSPAVKEIASKDEEFAKDIEEIRALNKKLEGLDGRLAAIRYFRLFGEAEARLTERLSYMTQEQLDTKDPYGYFDVTKFVVTNRQGVVVAKVEAPKNQQQTGEFNVVFDPETGRSIIDGSLVEAGRTSASNGKYNIRLAPEANAVTFAHELFHVFSLEMQRVYNEGKITDYWRKQADKMFKIAGAEPQVDPADPTVVRYFLTEAQEEHLANMFTTYIMKGKIENQEVRGLLSKLIDLFKTTYRQLEGAGLTPMALDSKALEFFNTVMSSQDAIEEIQRNAGLLEILPPEGVDRELYDYYIANLAVSKVEASNDLRRKLYAIDTFKNGAEYTKKMQEFKDNAKAELLEDDKYKVLAQASLYPEDKAQQTLLWAEKNIPEANFTLGDITDILENTPSLEEASTRAAEEEMDKYLAKRFNLTPQDVGFKEERNRAKVRALLAESVMQRGGTIADIEAEIRKADAASDKHLGKTSVYQIMDLGKWKNREAAAVERYAWAKNEGRKDLMSAERYNQAVLNLIMIKSAGFKNEYQKLTALFDKLQSRQRKYRRKDEFGNEYGEYEHRYHAQDWELLRSISENFGNKIRDGRRSMKPVHQQMKEWIQTQVENRFTTVAGLEDFIPFIDKGTDGSIGAMKGKDFKKLWAVMHTIDSIAMREQQLYLDGQYADMNKYIEQTLQFHSEKDIKTDEDKGDWYHKYFGRYGTWQNPEPLLRAIFPPEVFQKIFLPMFNGALKSEAKAKQWIERWKRAKTKINTSNEVFALDDGTQITYGETNKKTMTYGDVANLLIAMGAEHSYENYKLKFGLSDEQAEQIASQAIKRNAKYVEFMNETWNVYGEATELLNDSFQERTNELFVRKEHRAFTIDGIKFEGGYVPEDKHYLALVRELGTWNQGIHNKVENKNEKLITKLADGDILSIIDITETKLSQSAKWAYAAIPYNNVKKFVEKKEVSDAIGERAFNFIRDWLQNWDTPHVDESGVWRPLTRVTTIAALGMRASTALLQVSGLAQAMAHLGPTYLARGMLQFVREGGFFHPFKGPKDKSLYMATRVEDPFAARFGTESQGRSFREIFESYNAKSGLGKIGVGLLSAYQTLAMMGIQIIDGWVATITWNGAYRRALDQGMTTEQAKAEADSVVRVTQSDATQISRSSAMQEPWARSVTAFATWTMAMRSQVVALSSSKSYRKDMVMWLATYAVMSSFIEAFLKEMTEPADEGEEDKEMLERIMNSWYNKIVEAVGTQVMPFAGAGAAGAKMLAGALVNTDDEKIFKVFAGGSVPALQYASRAVQAGAQSIKYMRSGEEEDLDKMLIQSAGLVSYELKKRVKQALED